MKRLLLAVIAAAFSVTCAGAATTLVVGTPAALGGGNCYPWGCSYNAEYQQVYTHSLFSGLGTISITRLSFYNTQSSTGGATATNSGTFTVSLSTTSADWNTLSGTFASNLGADNRVVFSGSVAQAWAFGNTLTITLSTPFTYDPSRGSLLMDVVGSGITNPNGTIFFDVTSNSVSTVTSRDYCSGGVACSPTGSVDTGFGLVTGFTYGPASVPALSTWALAALILLVLASGLWALRPRRA